EQEEEEEEEDKYYIFKNGTYSVGRKGCDIIIHKDKGVSRIHAHIMVDEMTQSCQVRIRDLSKYGTFINKNLSSNKKVHHFPNKQTTLEDGDLLSFGTGNATFRFSYVPLVLYICCAEASQMNHHLQDKVSSIGALRLKLIVDFASHRGETRNGRKNWPGEKHDDKGGSVHLNPRPLALTTMPMPISARLTHVYSEDCTHVIVDQHVPLKRDLLDAIVAKKPLLRTSWLEYKFGDRLQSLLEVSGSRVNYVEEICSSSQNINTVITPRIKELKHRSPLAEYVMFPYLLDREHRKNGLGILPQAFGCGENTCLTYVIPGRSVDKFDHLDKLGLSYRVDEMALIRALLSGKLDQSILISSS
ncbi:hypothetical protein Goshw_022891, partial [Gossypium schwendimanii]|nr:hypothetical protein [Gossypium schwendimanii]